MVKGNIEIYNEREIKLYNNIIYYGKVGRVEFREKIIGICHEPYLFKKILELGPCDIIFYGHTHKPWIEEKGGVKLVNPGTLGGILHKATFAVWDSEKEEVELKILETLK